MNAKTRVSAVLLVLTLGPVLSQLAARGPASPFSLGAPPLMGADLAFRGPAQTAPGAGPAATKPAVTFGFSFDVVLPAPPTEIYDALTGDITGWWDHSFSEKPYRLYIEAKPGGGFFEIFGPDGDGARHATVIYAERGKKLRLDGPLGLSGQAVSLVTTYDLAPAGPGATRLAVSVRGAGDMDERTPGIVEQVWKHFIVERFKPYVESGAHRKAPR